ncbi:MAG: Gfo/Idh/MocA family protein, partial [Gemmatimonadales bacterium]
MAAKRVSRRTFVQETGAAVAFTVVPRHVIGRGYRAPSDTLSIACIGIGGMGRNDVNGVAGENIYALCDVDSKQGEGAILAYPRAKRFTDFRELLDKEGRNIDAVTVSTPDHTHGVAAMMAMKMGKHVRVQKPLARSLWEVRALVEQARRSPRIATQMGNQGHANEGTRQIREWVEAGAIGTVREVQLWTNRPIWPQGLERPSEAHNVPPWLNWDLWLGPCAHRPYHPAYAPFRWRGWWDFGTGALGDIACHSMDASFWTLALKYPSRIDVETSQLYAETAPRSSRLVYQFPATANRPEVRVVWRDGGLFPPRPAEVPA